MFCPGCGADLRSVEHALEVRSLPFNFCPGCGVSLPAARDPQALLRQLEGGLATVELQIALHGMTTPLILLNKREELKAEIEALRQKAK